LDLAVQLKGNEYDQGALPAGGEGGELIISIKSQIAALVIKRGVMIAVPHIAGSKRWMTIDGKQSQRHKQEGCAFKQSEIKLIAQPTIQNRGGCGKRALWLRRRVKQRHKVCPFILKGGAFKKERERKSGGSV